MKSLTRISTVAFFVGTLGAAGLAAADSGPGRGGDGGPGRMRGIDFTAIDTDGNGLLSREELTTRAMARLGAADSNGDGALDRAEIVAQMPDPHGGFANIFGRNPAEDRADRLLALMGATDAGRVPVAELADFRVNMLLSFVDDDRDSAISQDEANAAGRHYWRHDGPRDEMRGGMHGGIHDGMRGGMRGDGHDADRPMMPPAGAPSHGSGDGQGWN